jgi:hypothetical protein
MKGRHGIQEEVDSNQERIPGKEVKGKPKMVDRQREQPHTLKEGSYKSFLQEVNTQIHNLRNESCCLW